MVSLSDIKTVGSKLSNCYEHLELKNEGTALFISIAVAAFSSRQTNGVVPIMKAIELKHLCAFVCKHNGSLHVASSGSLIKIETTQFQYHRPH